MKKWLLAATLLALFVPNAFAQGNGRDKDKDRHPGGGQSQAAPGAPAAAPPARTGAAFRGEAAHHVGSNANPSNPNSGQSGSRFNNVQNNAQNNSQSGQRPGNNQSGSRFNNGQNNGQFGQRPGFAGNGPRPGTQRNSFSALNRTFTAPHRYRGPVYHRPAGFYVHRWTFGEFLPTAFWAQDYWLSDYFDFGLEPPPPGTRWVRYGSDALLIDRFSGEVIQVAYNVFY